MFQNNLLMAAGSIGGFVPLGVNFDGSNDYIQRNAAFVGQSNKAASWTQVVWVRSDSDGSEKEIHQGVAGCWDMLKRPTNQLQFYTIGPGCSGYRNTIFSDTDLVNASGWVCIMCSSNGSTNQMYYGDTDVTSSQATSTSTEDHTANSTWGAAGNASAKWNGDMAELYLDFDNRTDFSVEANRRKFFGADGKPVDLGDDGSTPSGASPCVYLSVRDGDAAAALISNRGTGGDYIEYGTLTLSATNPGD
jgi:hypothetical protein